MKKILSVLMVVFFVNLGQAQDCKSFSKNGWRIVYNKYLEKYAVMRIDSILIGTGNEKEFLVKDRDGEYGVYLEGWEKLHCSTCGDPSKSLFRTPCGAKSFLLDYLRKIKEYDWN